MYCTCIKCKGGEGTVPRSAVNSVSVGGRLLICAPPHRPSSTQRFIKQRYVRKGKERERERKKHIFHPELNDKDPSRADRN